MTARVNPRGQPVYVFAIILGGWTILRVMTWTSPFPAAMPLALPHSVMSPRLPAPAVERMTPDIAEAPVGSGDRARDLSPWGARVPLPAPLVADPGYQPLPPAWHPVHDDAPVAPLPIRRIAGHHLLLAAGFSNLTLPPEIAAFYGQQGAPPRPTLVQQGGQLAAADRPLLAATGLPAARGQGRWSADGWLLWRDGSGATAATPGAASYGRSQAGAVVRYRLASDSLLPQAYARATRTLEGARQAELAAGISLRPVAGLPVRVAAEGRLTETSAGRELRPAIFAVTELPPARLPIGLRGEAYAQVGYVGGDEATAFVDGQARVDGRLARLSNEGELRTGLGAWGGAQRGAARLDIGPSATVAFRLGDAPSRLALDYRLRVAGQAEPKSGPAVTFSAGF